MRSKPHPYTEAILKQSQSPNDYWSALNDYWLGGQATVRFAYELIEPVAESPALYLEC